MDAQLRLLNATTPLTTESAGAAGASDRSDREGLGWDGPVPEAWRLDDTTRAVGRLGVAQARAALQAAKRVAYGEATAA